MLLYYIRQDIGTGKINRHAEENLKDLQEYRKRAKEVGRVTGKWRKIEELVPEMRYSEPH